MPLEIVAPNVASDVATSFRMAWSELAYGEAERPERHLGQPWVAEFLPGLGEIAGWGLVVTNDGRSASGSIYTGFLPAPHRISVMLSSAVVDGYMTIDSMTALMELPSGCLHDFAIRSLVTRGPALRVTRGKTVVLETSSKRAAKLASELVQHLVGGGPAKVVEVASVDRPRLYVLRDENGTVTRYSWGTEVANSELVRDYEH